MSREALLHGNATATQLGVLRVWVFGMWFADIAKDPLTDLAPIPFSNFHPVGVLRLLPGGLWNVAHSVPVLRTWWLVLLALLALSALGTRGYRSIAVLACSLLTFTQGFIYSFAEVTHAELAALYVAWILAIFPSSDAVSVRPTAVRAPDAVYQATMVLATIVLLGTYTMTGVRRLFVGGIDIFLNGTILSMVAEGSATPDHLGSAQGLWALETPGRVLLLQAGFVMVSALEILSLWCMTSTWFRRCWLAVMLPFHLLSWPLLQTLFVHNILLILALVIDVDGLVRRLDRFRRLERRTTS